MDVPHAGQCGGVAAGPKDRRLWANDCDSVGSGRKQVDRTSPLLLSAADIAREHVQRWAMRMITLSMLGPRS